MAVFSKLRKGSEAAKKAAEGTGGKSGGFTPHLRWKDDDVHYVLFLQSMDDIPTVLFHKMMDCGPGKNGKTMWRDFISLRDPNLDGPRGYDPLDDLGYKPANKNIALVCEMEPVYGKVNGKKKIVSFEPMVREWTKTTEEGGKETVEEPAVYLVVESPSNFFSNFTSYADDEGPIEEQVFKIKRIGKDTNTRYNALPQVNIEFEAPDDIDELVERLEKHVEELADPDRMRELVEGAPEGHRFSKYAKLDGDKAPEKKTKAKKAKVAEPEEDDSDDDNEEEEAPKAKATPKKKKLNRFEELQKTLTGGSDD